MPCQGFHWNPAFAGANNGDCLFHNQAMFALKSPIRFKKNPSKAGIRFSAVGFVLWINFEAPNWSRSQTSSMSIQISDRSTGGMERKGIKAARRKSDAKQVDTASGFKLNLPGQSPHNKIPGEPDWRGTLNTVFNRVGEIENEFQTRIRPPGADLIRKITVRTIQCPITANILA